MTTCAFVGLGVMGYPMAGHLQAKGHEVTVYNRTTAKAEAWVKEHGGAMAPTPREAAEGADFVMTCVGNDDDLRGVCTGADGAFAGMADGAILVDHTTVSAAVTRELAAIAAGGDLGYVDAPISGGQAGAENGALSVMCGGPQEAFDMAAPVIDAYAKICRRLGDTGAGQITKMCNQIAIAGLVQGLSEALHFAQAAGMDGQQDFVRRGVDPDPVHPLLGLGGGQLAGALIGRGRGAGGEARHGGSNEDGLDQNAKRHGGVLLDHITDGALIGAPCIGAGRRLDHLVQPTQQHRAHVPGEAQPAAEGDPALRDLTPDQYGSFERLAERAASSISFAGASGLP